MMVRGLGLPINKGALINRTGFLGYILYHQYNREPPKEYRQLLRSPYYGL